MQALLALTRRELGSYFVSLTGYVIIAAAAFLTGLSFVYLFAQLRAEPSPLPVTELFYITPFFWLILLLACPVITMRTFAQEKFSGTYETLMTAPVRDGHVVLAKFGAALLFYLVMWLPLLACLLLAHRYGGGSAGFEPALLASTYLGILLVGALFLACGCFASALTRSQAVAAMISLLLCASLFLLSFVAERLPAGTPPWAANLLASLALFEQMHDFARGVVDTRPIVFFVSLTAFFLLLTLRVVESRRWK
ncbi:MAG: ABC transporter permease [Limisphaerales bacterium]